MLDTELREIVMNSPVLSDAMKQVLGAEISHLNENDRVSICTMIRSMEQAVGAGAEEFLAAHQHGDMTTILLQK